MTPRSTPKETTTPWTQRWSRMSQGTPNIARSRCPITAFPRVKLINLPPERRTARTMMHKHKLKATQDTLSRRWSKVLDTEEKYGDDRHTKSYPKHKLLPEFDDEATEPIPPKNNTADQPDRPPCGHNGAANDAAHKSAHDLRELLDKKAGATRSIYGSRGRAPVQDHNHQNNHIDRLPVRNQPRTQQPSTACHDTSNYRGAAHPCASLMKCWIMNFHRDSNP